MKTLPDSLAQRIRSCRGLVVAAGLLSCPLMVFSQASLIDQSFAADPGDGMVTGIVVLNDGKLLVAGGSSGQHLVRLEADGRRDWSFAQGTDGPVFRLLRQPDGKILVAGSFSNLLGVARQGIGRLLTNGDVDLTFDAGELPGSDSSIFALGLQPDGKILIGNLAVPGELFRLDSTGQLDASFAHTNVFNGYHVFALCSRTNGSILVGGGFQAVNGFATVGLALLGADGQLDTNFVSGLQTNSNPSVILESAQGVLVGGRQWRVGATNKLVVARLTTDLDWDASFQPDDFDPGIPSYSFARSLLVQPDGKLVVVGLFQQVGRYWRNGIVRLDAQGKVDPCFDPGVGLADWAEVGAMAVARQADGKILTGGHFVAFSGNANLPATNLVRFLPQSDCDATRVHLARLGPGQDFVAGTCAPGGTNHLQWSTNLVDWETVMSTPAPLLIYYNLPDDIIAKERMFFRVKKEF